jgi:hypothetical protein
MRRVGLLVIGVSVGLLGPGSPAFAAPTPTTASAAAPETVCTVSDKSLVELSGMVAMPDGGYAVANDSNDQAAAMRVSFLDSKCKLIRFVPYPAASPARDPEDLAATSDGTLWVADIGDNVPIGGNPKVNRRETVALWKFPAGGGAPIIHRLTYPDGPHDAEALLFGPGDVPVIVTKEPGGAAQIFEASEPLQPNTRQGVPLKNVGTFKPKATGTPNPLGPVGQTLVTGGAQTLDRKRVALRTYSDAYEWDVSGGDVVKAITKSEPRITPLPNEPQGEAIAYSTDGKSFLTCSDQTVPTKLLRYQTALNAVPAAAAQTTTAKKADLRPWYKKLTLPQVINIVGGVGVLGLILVVIGLIGIKRSRKARRVESEASAKRPSAGGDAAANKQRSSTVSAASPPPPTRGGGGPVEPRGKEYGQPARGGGVYGGGNVHGAASGPGTASAPGGGRGAASAPGGGRGAAGVPGSGSAHGSGKVRGEGTGNVYGAGRPQAGGGVYGGDGGGYAQPGYDRGGGRQEFSQPGYHIGYGGGDH